jgi:4'-phosphopantetheinyl transferase EntD
MRVSAGALEEEGLIPIGVDDPEPLRERQSGADVADEILQLAERAQTGEVVWDTFYVFETDDEE